MKLRTSLQLGALFPIVLTAVVCIGFVVILLHGPGFEAEIPVLRVSFSILALLMAGLLYKAGSDLINRIQRLEAVTRGVKAGRFEKIQETHGEDEISGISAGVNEMVDSLQKYVGVAREYDALKGELGRANKDLETLRAGEMDVSDGLERLSRAQNLLVEYERMNLLAHMFSGISHDLNDALTSILARTEFALEFSKGKLSAQTRNDYTAIRSAATKLKAEFDGLSSYYRMPSAQRASINLADILAETIKLSEPKWKTEAESRGATIEVTTALDSLPLIEGNRQDLIQMFVAVLFNAAEAMDKGGSITITAKDSGNGFVSVAIADTGKGMNEDVKRRCRRPFFTTKDGAAGVGLPVAAGIVRQHGGKLGLVSEEGQGTVVYIDLPIGARRLDSVAPEPVVNTLERPLRILFVEDDQWTLEILTKGLEEGKHQVMKCRSGSEAIERFKESGADVVITDRAMPGMSGEDLAGAIRQRAPHMPIILLTGFGDIIKSSGASIRNVDLVIPKPVSISELHNGLADVMALMAHRSMGRGS